MASEISLIRSPACLATTVAPSICPVASRTWIFTKPSSSPSAIARGTSCISTVKVFIGTFFSRASVTYMPTCAISGSVKVHHGTTCALSRWRPQKSAFATTIRPATLSMCGIPFFMAEKHRLVLHPGHSLAQAGKGLRELASDGTAADDQQSLRALGEVEHILVGQESCVGESRNRRSHGVCTGRDESVLE